jgi:hypothetical protein
MRRVKTAVVLTLSKEQTVKRIMYRIIVITMAFVITAAGYTGAQATSNKVTTPGPKVYAYYYLWWSSNHWQNKLGASYPYTASPLPLPARMTRV